LWHCRVPGCPEPSKRVATLDAFAPASVPSFFFLGTRHGEFLVLGILPCIFTLKTIPLRGPFPRRIFFSSPPLRSPFLARPFQQPVASPRDFARARRCVRRFFSFFEGSFWTSSPWLFWTLVPKKRCVRGTFCFLLFRPPGFLSWWCFFSFFLRSGFFHLPV